MSTVGVLALQGDYAAHAKAANALGHETLQVRTEEALERTDALLLPGGAAMAKAPNAYSGKRKLMLGLHAAHVALPCVRAPSGYE